MSGSVFLDSGIFVAFLNRRDQWHEQAVVLFNGPQPKWFSSFLVVSETYSWFLHRMGEEPARTFVLFLQNLDGLRILEATVEHHVSVMRMLNKLHGAKLSYVDASSLCFLERYKIQRVWSTDHHLGLTGVEVMPRS